MNLEELCLPLISFKLAKHSHHKTIIYGCGIGPLTEKRYLETVKKILFLADEIMLRDSESVKFASELLPGKKVVNSGDFAERYLNNKNYDIQLEKKNVLRCYLREFTLEYAWDMTSTQYIDFKLRFEKALANFVKKKALELNVDGIVLEHMHNFVIGKDDRDFSRYFIKKYFDKWDFVPVSYTKKLSDRKSVV